MIEAKYNPKHGDRFSNLYALSLLIYYIVKSGGTVNKDCRKY
jgi:hypothetical protein